MPAFSVLFLVVTFPPSGCPASTGSWGSSIILVGAFQWNRTVAALAPAASSSPRLYMLWMYQRVFFGEITREENRHFGI